MNITLITAVFNQQEYLASAFKSVRSQTLSPFEHLIIDGGSTDNSLTIAKEYASNTTRIISEPDDGLYNALNKGASLATGEIIGFLHADDFFSTEKVLNDVMDLFTQKNADCVYGDLQYVQQQPPHRVIRQWNSGKFSKLKLRCGWAPPHPTLFLRRALFHRIGGFEERFKISADYDFMLRLLSSPQINVQYLPKVLVKMRIGGKSSTVKNLFRKSAEDYIAIRRNNVGSFPTLVLKNISKLPQFFIRRIPE
jgi:glycosyltransferase involved in cell wall biosynthesis